MPRLKRYKDSEREGHYILANFGGDRPVTLQTTFAASEIFDLMGYDDGDVIPKKLVDAMYDLELLYTISSFSSDLTRGQIDPHEALVELGILNTISEAERERIIGILKHYSGPSESRVQGLAEKLLNGSSMSSEDIDFEPRDFIQDLPETPEEIRSVFLSWVQSEITERAKTAFQLCEPFVTRSVRTFYNHNRLVETPICRISNGEIVYELEPVRNSQKLFVADLRGKSGDAEYRITRKYSETSEQRAHVSDGTILDYEEIGETGTYFVLSHDVERIVPQNEPNPITMDESRISSGLLRDEHLSTPVDRLDEEYKAPDPGEDIKDVDELDRKLDVIESSFKWRWFEVDGISSSGNAKVELGNDLVVMTGLSNVDRGDRIVVRWDGTDDAGHTVIERAERLTDVPSKDTKWWLENNL